MTNGISGHKNDIVKIDMGKLNCFGEPHIIEVGDQKIILRYNHSASKEDFGTLTLERAIDCCEKY